MFSLLLKDLISDFYLNEIMFTISEVETPVQKLNSGKSPDEYGLSAEHFKFGKDIISEHYYAVIQSYFGNQDNSSIILNRNLNPCDKKD